MFYLLLILKLFLDLDFHYMDYIYQIKQNEIAREVKLLDLRHNLDETRFPLEIRDEMLEKMKKKQEKYKQAIKILEK